MWNYIPRLHSSALSYYRAFELSRASRWFAGALNHTALAICDDCGRIRPSSNQIETVHLRRISLFSAHVALKDCTELLLSMQLVLSLSS